MKQLSEIMSVSPCFDCWLRYSSYCMTCEWWEVGIGLKRGTIMEYDWLQKLKPGDNVVVCSWNWMGSRQYKIKPVEKITPSGLIKVNGSLYRPDGHTRGEYARCVLLNPKDEDVMAKVRHYKETELVSNVLYRLRKLDSLTAKQANKFKLLLDEVEKETKEE